MLSEEEAAPPRRLRPPPVSRTGTSTVINPFLYGDAIVRHDSGVQILADVSVSFNVDLERSVGDSASFFTDGTRLEQHLRATETFGADSDDVSVWELVGILPV